MQKNMEADNNGPTITASLAAAATTNNEVQNNAVDGSGDVKQLSAQQTTKTEESPIVDSRSKDNIVKSGADNLAEPQISNTTDSTDNSQTVKVAEVSVGDAAAPAVNADEAMEVEDSSSNDVEMHDLSREGAAGLEADAKPAAIDALETPTTTTVDVGGSGEPHKLDAIGEAVDETDTKTSEAAEAAPIASSDAVAESPITNDAEYQDVEKNISSLFNGDESVEITSSSSTDKIDAVKVPEKCVDVETVEQPINNGTGSDIADAVAKSSDESAKELVSILEDDKVPAKPIADTKSLSTLTKSGASPPAATATTQTVFSSASENVSTVSALIDADKSVRLDAADSKSSDTGAGSDGTGSTDTPTRFTNSVRKYNGIGDPTDSTNGKSTVSSPITSTADEHTYEVNIWYNERSRELLCFNGERIGTANKTDAVEKVSSSVGSSSSQLDTLPLPDRMGDAGELARGSSADPTMPTKKIRQTITGTVELCKFVIEHFQKLGRSFSNDNAFATGVTDHTLSSGRRGGDRTSAAASSTTAHTAKDIASTPTTGGKRKRTDVIADDDEPRTMASAKQMKRDTLTTPTTPTADYPEKVVLARWVDKKYYAGRVIEKKPNQKFVVLFEDGAKKVLPRENIVFGNKDTLPLLNECVHALVNDDTYEPGTVRAIERKGETVCYMVECESTIVVTVTGSDIYLEEDQAKIILTKQDTSALNEPEPGSSGTANTRKDRRQKREKTRRGPPDLSESDITDPIDLDSTPTSPKQTAPVEAIVLVHGVQPELQITHEESKCDKLRFLIENFGQSFRSVNLDDILGPINECNLFRNKGFLLTCTIPIKSTENVQHQNNHEFDLANKCMHFSTLPFFKEHLRSQIEAAGGKVYNHFEDIPRNKHRTCILLAPFPCLTAAYVQCLAANIPAISHEWLIKCCESQTLVKKDDYALPSGWSMTDQCYRLWSTGAVGKLKQLKRKSNSPFNKITIIITSQQEDFAEFWSRVCRAAGAKIRTIKSKTDFTITLRGYILMDDEFPQEYRAMATDYNIPVVSTVWVVQSLIVGQVCDPGQHEQMTQLYDDENL